MDQLIQREIEKFLERAIIYIPQNRNIPHRIELVAKDILTGKQLYFAKHTSGTPEYNIAELSSVPGNDFYLNHFHGISTDVLKSIFDTVYTKYQNHFQHGHQYSQYALAQMLIANNRRIR